jgi:hypothetical protein
MRWKLGLAVALTAIVAAVGLTAPAHAAPLSASPWQKVFLHAHDGNGCASYTGGIGSPVYSFACSGSNWWNFRDLSRSSGAVQSGDTVEYACSDFSCALYFSRTGGWELNVPSDTATVQRVGTISGGWQGYWDVNVFAGMYPKASTVQLGAPAPPWTNPPDAWIPCPLSTPTCAPPGVIP